MKYTLRLPDKSAPIVHVFSFETLTLFLLSSFTNPNFISFRQIFLAVKTKKKNYGTQKSGRQTVASFREKWTPPLVSKMCKNCPNSTWTNNAQAANYSLQKHWKASLCTRSGEAEYHTPLAVPPQRIRPNASLQLIRCPLLLFLPMSFTPAQKRTKGATPSPVITFIDLSFTSLVPALWKRSLVLFLLSLLPTLSNSLRRQGGYFLLGFSCLPI